MSSSTRRMIELPRQDPCEFCEGLAGRSEDWAVVVESDLVLTVVNPYQFETGQCCVITRRHVGTLLELTSAEGAAVITAAREIAHAMLMAYRPLAILTYQNNGVYSGQEVPHYHFHVVPRQEGSDWGIGPPQLQAFPGAGRASGTGHDPSTDAARMNRVKVDPATLYGTADLLRRNLPRQTCVDAHDPNGVTSRQGGAVPASTIFEALGGDEGVLRLAHAWHARVLADEIVAHAFSHGFHPRHTERLAAYWGEAWGGPPTYSERYGNETSVVRMHSGNGTHEEMDRRAIECFDQAMADVGIVDPRLRQVLHDYFAWATTTTMSAYPETADDVPDGLLIPRWSWEGRQD